MKRLTCILAIVCHSLASAATVSYSYDAAGRLAKVDYGAGRSITYTYDPAGNLLSRTATAAATTGSAEKTPQTAAAPEKTSGHAADRRVTGSSHASKK